MKRILVISNAAFSNTDSNGRTVANMFLGYEKESLAQFCTYGTPEFSVCDNFYRVTDGEALKSFLKQREFGGIVKNTDSSFNAVPNAKRGKKTPLKLLLRETAWKYGGWWGEKFKGWIKEFSPEVIFICVANNAFMLNIATKIAKCYNIPIVVYSTEDYYFKDYNYITKKPSLFYKIYLAKLRKAYKNMEPLVVKGIFNTPFLAELYAKEFSYPCEYVFAKSNIDFIDNSIAKKEDNKRISYLGNMGVGRHKALIEIANALVEINPQYRLDLYGKIPNEEIKREFENCRGINYKGFVSYSEVVEIMHNSDLLIHAECDDEFYKKDLKYAFSTKIADSICSGTPFLIYADASLAETRFLIEEKCGFVVTERELLKEILISALSDSEKRKAIIKNAQAASKKYFRGE